MLGVAPDASTEEIRAAYRRLAFERHPDRTADRSPEGVARAEAGMAGLNEAVETLTDPLRRQRYDAGRHGAGPAGTGSRAHGPGPGSAGVVPGPTSAQTPGAAVGPVALLARVTPWAALLLVLAAIFVFTAYAGGGDEGPPGGEDEPTGTVAVRDLRGSCIQRSGGFTLVVNCGVRPNEGRIVAQASPDATCPDGTEAWLVPQEELLACTDPTTATPRDVAP